MRKNTPLKVVTILPAVALLVIILANFSFDVRFMLEFFLEIIFKISPNITYDTLLMPAVIWCIFIILVSVPVLFAHCVNNKREGKAWKWQLFLSVIYGLIAFFIIIMGMPYGSGIIIGIPLFLLEVMILSLILFIKSPRKYLAIAVVFLLLLLSFSLYLYKFWIS